MGDGKSIAADPINPLYKRYTRSGVEAKNVYKIMYRVALIRSGW